MQGDTQVLSNPPSQSPCAHLWYYWYRVTHPSFVSGFEFKKAANVEGHCEQDQPDNGAAPGVLSRGRVRVAHAQVPLDGHGQGAVDGSCEGDLGKGQHRGHDVGKDLVEVDR